MSNSNQTSDVELGEQPIKKELVLRGTQIAYYQICKTKLWLFSNGISMEHLSDLVKLGKLIHSIRYQDEERDLIIDSIAIDFVRTRRGFEIHEIKKTSVLEEAHILQLKYYLFYLKLKGFPDLEGVIHYPKMNKIVKVELRKEDEEKLSDIHDEIQAIIKSEKPPKPIKRPYCKKCAYYDLCWV